MRLFGLEKSSSDAGTWMIVSPGIRVKTCSGYCKHSACMCQVYGTPEGTFPFQYLSEKKLKQEN